MVNPVTCRGPAVLAKAVTKLDVLSGGRMWFGVGAGYQAEGAEAMGLASAGLRGALAAGGGRWQAYSIPS